MIKIPISLWLTFGALWRHSNADRFCLCSYRWRVFMLICRVCDIWTSHFGAETENVRFNWKVSSNFIFFVIPTKIGMSEAFATMENPESAILDRRDYKKESTQSANTIKNEIVFKVMELEQKLQQFDSLYCEQFKQIHSLIGRIFDRPNVRIPMVANVAKSQCGRSQTSPPSLLPEITMRPMDEADGLIDGSDAARPMVTQPEAQTNDIGSESGYSEEVFTVQPLAESSRHDTPEPDVLQFNRKLRPYTPLLCAERSQTPNRYTSYRVVGEQQKATDANTKSPSNNTTAFAWMMIVIVIVFFVAFVVGEADGLATIETIAKLSIDYMERFKTLMMQSLFEQSKRHIPIDPHHNEPNGSTT